MHYGNTHKYVIIHLMTLCVDFEFSFFFKCLQFSTHAGI